MEIRCTPDVDRSSNTGMLHSLGLESFVFRWLRTLIFAMTIQISNFPCFRLELHLPFYVLRETNGREMDELRQGRKARDVSFLSSQEHNITSGYQYLYEAQVSLLIHGYGRTNWEAYAFVDDAETFGLRVDNQIDQDDSMLHFPTFASYASCEKTDSEEKPLDPREYFLRIAKYRTAQVLSEWRYLVRKLEQTVVILVSDASPIILHFSTVEDNKTYYNAYWIGSILVC